MRTEFVIGQRAHPTVAVLVDVLLAVVVVTFGLWSGGGGSSVAVLVVILAAALAAGSARRWTATALAAVWVVALAQVYADGPVFAVTLAIEIVAFRCARYGSRRTTGAAGLSIPVGAVIALLLAYDRPASVRGVAALANVFTGYGVGAFGGFLVLGAVLTVPFAAGLLLRVNENYRRTRVAHELAQSQAAAQHAVAQSQVAQTMLARDVHDVVGHSLAVIIAQADSARAGADHADESVRIALAQIADVGRSSLAEIRDVLRRTRDTVPVSGRERCDDLAELVAGVRNAGNPVIDTVTGDPQPLGPETAAAAYRVLQELLTNALKHGTAGSPIEVCRSWTAHGLTLRVENSVTDTMSLDEGMGLAGVRSRLAAHGGGFRTAVTGQSAGARVVATAFLPTAP